MSDYDDKSYYEVQLEQKQLVLILLLMVAICVLFFFLGVYYARGREPVGASNTNHRKPATPEAVKPPDSPAKVDTEQVSRFFETGGSKEGATKAEFEGGKVIAESRPTDPTKKTPTPGAAPEDRGAKGVKPLTPALLERTPRATPQTPPAPSPSPNPPDVRKETPRPTSAAGAFIVQIGAMKDVERANKVRNELKGKGFPAYVETQDAGDGEKLYKVRVGPYGQRTEAEQAKDALRAEGHGTAFVSGE